MKSAALAIARFGAPARGWVVTAQMALGDPAGSSDMGGEPSAVITIAGALTGKAGNGSAPAGARRGVYGPSRQRRGTR
jgi:hypothetical protein